MAVAPGMTDGRPPEIGGRPPTVYFFRGSPAHSAAFVLTLPAHVRHTAGAESGRGCSPRIVCRLLQRGLRVG